MSRIGAVLLAIGMAALPAAGQVAKSAVLPEKYRIWLDEEAVFLITPTERDVFLKLDSDRSREIFIEAFWKQRDPVPETPRNEFREEHYRRLQYANRMYGRGSRLPGWKTDRGKIYIVLGPPRNIESFDDINNVHPTEIWFYQDTGFPTLPVAFNIIFFKRNGFGDYVLYSPAADGPRSLIATAMGDARDEQAYRDLRELAPNLASQVLSLIPGERRPSRTPSLSSETLLADIFDSPRRKIKDAYAEALLRYKDAVEVEYTANYIDVGALLYVSRSGDGTSLIHYAVSPARLTLASSGGRNEAFFSFNGRLTDVDGRTVYQFEKSFPLSFNDADVGEIRATSIVFQDVFPCVPGRFRFDLLLKNTVSKEFGSFEAAIEIPDPGAGPAVGSLFLGYSAETAAFGPAEAVPFRIGGRQLLGDVRNRFVAADTMRIVFQAFGLPEAWTAGGRIRADVLKDSVPVLSQTRTPAEAGAGETFFLEQSLRELKPGYYDLEVTLLDGAGRELARRGAPFEVGLPGRLARPRVLSGVTGADYAEEWDYALGLQYLNLGKSSEAGRAMARAYEKHPENERFASGYSQALYLLGESRKAKDVLLPLAEDENAAPEVLAGLGRACQSLGEFREAIAHYRRYLARAGTNIEILNYIGTCHYQLGEKDAALDVWNQSLKINPRQERLKALVDSLAGK